MKAGQRRGFKRQSSDSNTLSLAMWKDIFKVKKKRESDALNKASEAQEPLKKKRFARCKGQNKIWCDVCSKEDCKKCSNCL